METPSGGGRDRISNTPAHAGVFFSVLVGEARAYVQGLILKAQAVLT